MRNIGVTYDETSAVSISLLFLDFSKKNKDFYSES